jgi:hypothetical protein
MKARRVSRQIHIESDSERVLQLIAAAFTVAANELCNNPEQKALLQGLAQRVPFIGPQKGRVDNALVDAIIDRVFVALGLRASQVHVMLTDGLRMLARGKTIQGKIRSCFQKNVVPAVLQAIRDELLSCESALDPGTSLVSAGGRAGADPDLLGTIQLHAFFAEVKRIVSATSAAACLLSENTGTVRYEKVAPWQKAFEDEIEHIERCSSQEYVEQMPAADADAQSTPADSKERNLPQHRVLQDGAPGCWPNGSTSDISRDFLYRSVYLRQIQRLHTAFGSHGVLVLRQIDLQRRQEATLARVLAFLGLPESVQPLPVMTALATEARCVRASFTVPFAC